MNAPLLSLRGIDFAYDDGRRILRDLTLRVYPGERVCLTGPNGCGKTTLLHVAMGLVQPQSGEVEIVGRVRQTEADFRDARGRVIGLLFQDADAQLFSPTVFDDVAFGPLNLGLSPAEARARVHETLAELNLTAYEDRITYRLSQGEKRLVALATILAMRPAVLLLDEPTAGLDPRHERMLTDILCKRSEAMLIISHNGEFMARVATRQLTMADGRIQAADSPHPETALHEPPLS